MQFIQLTRHVPNGHDHVIAVDRIVSMYEDHFNGQSCTRINLNCGESVSARETTYGIVEKINAATTQDGPLRKRFEFDEVNHIVRIDGVKFSANVFDAFAGSQPGVKFAVERKGDLVTVTWFKDEAP